MRGFMMLVTVLAILPLASGSGMAQSQERPARGRALVTKLCSSCHAVGRSGASPRTGAPPFRKLGDYVDLDTLPAKLQQGISSAHPEMPTFKFKPADARAVRAYLQSIQN